MAGTISYLDRGAVQRVESGSATIHVSYLDRGAAQRQESSAVASATTESSVTRRPGGTLMGPGIFGFILMLTKIFK